MIAYMMDVQNYRVTDVGKFCTWFVAILFAVVSAGCGGAGGTQEANNTPVVTASAVVSIEPTLLSSSGAVKIERIETLLETRPLDSSISYLASDPSASIFALDSTGDIVLGSRISSGSVTFTIQSTVRYLAALVASTFISDHSLEALESKVSTSPRFLTACEAFRMAYLAGINPSKDASFQRQLSELVQDVLNTEYESLEGLRAARVQQAALPVNRVDTSTKDPVDNSLLLFRSSMQLLSKPLSMRISQKLGPSRHVISNNTPVFWDARVNSVSGASFGMSTIEPASLLGSLLGVGPETEIPKFQKTGAYSVRMQPAYEANARKMAATIIGLAAKVGKSNLPKESITKCADTVVGALFFQQVKSLITNTTDWSQLIGGIKAAIVKSPDILGQCFAQSFSLPAKDAVEGVIRISKVLDWILLGAEATEMAMQAKIWLEYYDKPIDIGVCVNSSNLIENCIASIAVAFEPPPIAAGFINQAYVKESVKFYTRGGDVAAMPADLTCSYEPATGSLASDVECVLGSYDVTNGLNYWINTTGRPSKGFLRLFDSATDTETRIPVRVTHGRLSPSNITISTGETATLTFVEQDGDQALIVPPSFGLSLGMSSPDAASLRLERVNDTAKILVTGGIENQSSSVLVRSMLSPNTVLSFSLVQVLATSHWELKYAVTNSAPDRPLYGWAWWAPAYAPYLPMAVNAAPHLIYPTYHGRIQT